MTLEEKYNEIMEDAKRQIRLMVDEALADVHCGLAPHLEDDTIGNVMTKTDQVVRALVEGQINRISDDCVLVNDLDGVGVRISITDCDYDNLRKNLIEAMPACPKDLEIQSLKKQLARAYDTRF